ncbi:MAG: hypothetical protein A3C04_00120 [Candidatus Wildermuthbacteria bacterium RIFCSPHIGHO2_02_FULL_45_25]|uniref:Uncharacterized protein n=1 Tax=Candidatus Wildermuthbacteria bacterium RIFCSPHIGHO2_02_FULL_45_25 TaxID=1802450 RepID=A0A1G2QZ88_9BACT|nr:MAG: hypothetical protein A3C04_00120 [Candidatus Wildermuthbacteria bacterium RIFCSPHIGHO2_02_FULL_45_25]
MHTFSQQLKNIFLKHTDKTLLIGVSLGVLFFVLTPEISSANVLSTITGIGADIADKLFGSVVGIIANLAAIIFFGIASFLNWIVQNVLSIPVVPGKAAVVTEGWNFTRSLVNIFFLLVLVFIGLATILNLQNYQLKRTLPTLIIIAVLVNFSGVLVGVMVDIGNLLASSFLGAVQSARWEDLQFPGAGGTEGKLVFEIARILYYFVASLIYLAIIAVFVLRVFILWTLAILAPLAFACYILPATRKWWNQWWSSLIQWAFVGVPISFFLWLAGKVLSLSAPDLIGSEAVGSAGPTAAFFAPITSLFILVFGVTVSMSLAPSMAQKAANFAKKTAMVGAGTFAGVTAARFLAREKTKRDLGEKTNLSRLENLMNTNNPLGKTVATATGARWATRTAMRKGLEQGAKAQKTPAALEKQYAEIAGDETLFNQQMRAFTPIKDDAKKAALTAARLKEKGTKAAAKMRPDDLHQALTYAAKHSPEQFEEMMKYNSDLSDAAEAEKRFGKGRGAAFAALANRTMIPDQTARKKDNPDEYEDSHLQAVSEFEENQELVALTKSTDTQKAREAMQKLMQKAMMLKIVESLKTVDFEKIDRSMANNEEFRRAFVRSQKPAAMTKIAEDWGGLATERIQKEIDDLDSEIIAKTNPNLVAWSSSAGGQYLGRQQKFKERKSVKAKGQPDPNLPGAAPEVEIETGSFVYLDQRETQKRLKEVRANVLNDRIKKAQAKASAQPPSGSGATQPPGERGGKEPGTGESGGREP